MKKKTIAKTIEIAHAVCPINRQTGVRAAHVAFLIKKNKIVKIGWNKNRTHPKTKSFPYLTRNNRKYEKVNVGIHAELDVIMKSGIEDLSNYQMVVLRVDGTGKLNNSRPCTGCASAIKQMGISNVFYSNSCGEVVHECY